jgi:hypothetical protein
VDADVDNVDEGDADSDTGVDADADADKGDPLLPPAAALVVTVVAAECVRVQDTLRLITRRAAAAHTPSHVRTRGKGRNFVDVGSAL